MSRYFKQIEEKNLSVAYGFDRAMGYFFQVFDENKLDDDEERLIIDEDSLLTGMSNGRMLELMVEYDVNEDHRLAVTLDLPF
jgi:hypothetical protein